MYKFFYAAAGIILMQACSTSEPRIAEFRGPERSGIYQESGLLTQWPDSGLTETIYIEGIGNGYGSPVFVDDVLYVTGETDSLAYLYAYNLNGTEIWHAELGNEWIRSFPGSRSAPTVVDDRIYAGNGLGDLYCLDRHTGELVWNKLYEAEFDGTLPYHGYSEAPTVYEDLVFWTPGGIEYNVVAMDRHTGALRWSHKGFGETMGYNPGKVIVHNERPIFVTFSSYHLMGFDARTGELLWNHEQTNLPDSARKPGYGDTHSNTPIYADGVLYYVAGDGNGGVRLDLSEDGSSIVEQWINPSFDSFMGGVVAIDGYLYGCSMKARDLRSVRMENGHTIDSAAVSPGVVIAADSMLYYYNMRGELMLFDYDQGTLTQVSDFSVTKGTREHFSHPAIHNGVLYVRHGNAIVGYDLRKESY
jgi:outer membrane protein assembly factor BamB